MPFLPIFLNKIKLHIVRHLRIISYMRAFLQLGLVKLSRMLERPVEAGAPPPKPSHQVRVRPWLLRLSHLTRSRAGLELCWHVDLTWPKNGPKRSRTACFHRRSLRILANQAGIPRLRGNVFPHARFAIHGFITNVVINAAKNMALREGTSVTVADIVVALRDHITMTKF